MTSRELDPRHPPRSDFFADVALGRVAEACAAIEERPARVNEYSPDGLTPLHLAARFGHAELVARLIERGADLVAWSRDAAPMQPLHAALAGERGDETAPLLLDAGADPYAPDRGGRTPLALAMAHGCAKCVRLLRHSRA